jgi:hypothetical protein
MAAEQLLALATPWITTGVVAFVLWIVLLIVLGIKTLRKGHWVMFLIGIPLPIFWLIGALIPARR